MKEIYIVGVIINLISIIRCFKDDEFIILMEQNFPLDNKMKVMFLLSTLLSWIIPIYLLFKKRH